MLHPTSRFYYDVLGPDGQAFKVEVKTDMPAYDKVLRDLSVQTAFRAACERIGCEVLALNKIEELHTDIDIRPATLRKANFSIIEPPDWRQQAA